MSYINKYKMSQTLWSVWTDVPALQIPNTQLTLKGFSIAALRTNFYIPELGVMFDSGLSGSMSPDYIFITHGHGDHSANIPFHLLSSTELNRVQVYVPENDMPNSAGVIDKCHVGNMLRMYINGLYCLSCNTTEDKLRIGSVYDLHIAQVGRLGLYIKNKIDVEVIKCDHSVPCVGYGLIEKRAKLKSEYAGMSGKEIGVLRKAGTDVSQIVEIPFFCYLGDTSCKILEDTTIEKYNTIMIECTFIKDEDLAQAIETQHMHWSQLEQYILDRPHITFILYHFSQRNKPEEIDAFFKEKNIANIIPWISK
jgi:ribonuclease Z